MSFSYIFHHKQISNDFFRKDAWIVSVKKCICIIILHLANAATVKGKTAASVPPVTMTSTSPFLISLNASPIACAPAEQAVDVARFGPC
jgi:hypothetical protein